MKRGKQTCKILKDIRRQIAEANDIEFITSECQYQGDCLGTCPKCESEVRYLEQQLERKRMAGKAITILGISAGLATMTSMTSCSSFTNKGANDKEQSEQVLLGDIIPISEEDTIVASIEDVPSPPETKMQPEINTLGEITGDVDIPDSVYATPGFIQPDISNPPSENDTLQIAAVMPEFPGGAQALMAFIAKNIQYPKGIAQGEMCAQGRVIIRFVVDKEGNIVNPEVLRSIDHYLDKEALRVVRLMPKWKPGELEDGTKVAVYYTIPVSFRLQ